MIVTSAWFSCLVCFAIPNTSTGRLVIAPVYPRHRQPFIQTKLLGESTIYEGYVPSPTHHGVNVDRIGLAATDKWQ